MNHKFKVGDLVVHVCGEVIVQVAAIFEPDLSSDDMIVDGFVLKLFINRRRRSSAEYRFATPEEIAHAVAERIAG